MLIKIPYGRSLQSAEVRSSCGVCLVEPKSPDLSSGRTGVAEALASPIGSPRLSDLARGRSHVVILSPDHTRAMPSRDTISALLDEIWRGNAAAKVTLLVATGLHRAPTQDELLARYGSEILRSVRVVCHDPDDEDALEPLGTLPSGSPLYINKIAAQADLLVAEGLLEPHFFAGYSGGRKLVLPGVASRKSVLYNHSAGMIGHSQTRVGVTSGNLVAADMEEAARRSRLAFALSVCVDENKRIIAAFAGEPLESHRQGCEYVEGLAQVTAEEADVTVVGNGGYPLDQNLYQAVKGMHTAAYVTRPGGVIVMCAECVDGVGARSFQQVVSSARCPEDLLRDIEATLPMDTVMDQWQAQALAQVLCKCRVILVSENISPEVAASMHLLHAGSLAQGLEQAESIVGRVSRLNVIPDGVSVVVRAAGN